MIDYKISSITEYTNGDTEVVQRVYEGDFVPTEVEDIATGTITTVSKYKRTKLLEVNKYLLSI